MLLGKNYDNALSFAKVIRQNIVASFPEAVGHKSFLMTSSSSCWFNNSCQTQPHMKVKNMLKPTSKTVYAQWYS